MSKTNIPEDIKEIRRRIKTIKEKKSTEERNNKKTEQNCLVVAFQVAVEMISGVIIGISIGYILDEVFDFQFLFLVIFTIFGGIAGIVNVSRYMNGSNSKGE